MGAEEDRLGQPPPQLAVDVWAAQPQRYVGMPPLLSGMEGHRSTLHGEKKVVPSDPIGGYHSRGASLA